MKYLFLLFLLSASALALPLQSLQQFNASGDPADSKRVLNNAMMARGSGTRDFYFLEVDPATGALPVTATFGGTLTASFTYKRGPGAVYVDTPPTYDTTVPANNRPLPVGLLAGDSAGPAAFGAGTTNAQTLRVVLPTDQTPIPVTGSFGPSGPTDFGATTTAPRSAAVIGNTTGQAAFGSGASSAQTLRTVIATDQTSIPVVATQGTTPWVVDGSGVTQPVSGTIAATQSGPWTVSATQGTDPWIVDGSATTQPISAAALPLPAGASTSALQTAGNVSLANIDTKLTNPIPVTQGSTPWIVDGSATTQPISAAALPLPVGASTSALQTSGNASLTAIDAGIPAALGQTTMAASMPVTFASDQTPLPVSATIGGTTFDYGPSTTALRTASQIGNVTGAADFDAGATGAQTLRTVANQGTSPWIVDGSATTQPISAAALPLPAGASTSALQTAGNTSLASIDTKLTNPLPVSGIVQVADDVGPITLTNPLPVAGSVTAAQGTTPWVVGDGGGSITVDAAALPLPAGASTSALQTAGNASLSSIDAKLTNPLPVSFATPVGVTQSTTPWIVDGSATTQPVSGTVTANQGTSPWIVDGSATTQPISAVALPLPTGASTSALQTSGNSSLTAIAASTASIDTKLTNPLPVSGTVTANQGGAPWSVTIPTPVPVTDNGGSLTVDGTVAVTQSTSPWVVSGTVATSNLPATADTNYGTPGASTVRTASMLGVGSTAVSNSNPVPISDAGGSITVDGAITSTSASTFTRIKNQQYLDTEEALYDIPLSTISGFIYVGIAPNGTSTGSAAWTVVRTSFDANGNPSRDQIRTGVVWTSRTSGW